MDPSLRDSYGAIPIEIKVEIKEAATGITLKSKPTNVGVNLREVDLSFETRHDFKPGLPLKVKVDVIFIFLNIN